MRRSHCWEYESYQREKRRRLIRREILAGLVFAAILFGCPFLAGLIPD